MGQTSRREDDVLRSIEWETSLDGIHNIHVRKELNINTLRSMIENYRLWWLGLVKRMEDGKIPVPKKTEEGK